MRIVPLAQRIDAAAVLARWHYEEWSPLYPGWSVEAAHSEFEAHADPDRIPTTLLALSDGDELLGSVSLLLADLPGFEHLTPWLASLFVRPDRRGAGIGDLLIEAALGEARRLGVRRLFLFTTRHESYYAARGWAIWDRALAAGTPAVVMSRPVVA